MSLGYAITLIVLHISVQDRGTFQTLTRLSIFCWQLQTAFLTGFHASYGQDTNRQTFRFPIQDHTEGTASSQTAGYSTSWPVCGLSLKNECDKNSPRTQVEAYAENAIDSIMAETSTRLSKHNQEA